MTLGELIGPELGLPPAWAKLSITGLTADSRAVQPGYLFAALPGVKTDGTRFIAEAVEKGAAAILLGEGAAPQLNGMPVVEDADPRRRLSLIAARFFGTQPKIEIAVTGTNGKTSVAAFTRQLWEGQGFRAASLGTVGVVSPAGTETIAHTTPDPVSLHAILAKLARAGVTHLALEASSHGLQQRRIDGVDLAAAAFTNISRDHLDYHTSFEEYFAQKLRLFRELLPEGSTAVVDVDSEAGERVAAECSARGLRVISVGRAGKTLRIVSSARDGFAQRLEVEHEGKSFAVRLPLVGDFQTANALVAAGLCLATGGTPGEVLPLLAGLRGARGRLDLAGTTKSGARIFIDYAHTPDALAKALDALRPYVQGRLIVVFGCGGDRDQGKRPEMGTAAETKADIVFVTDDNPRSEDPAAIRHAILVAAPSAIEVAGRGRAVERAIAGLRQGDVLLIAGKGHETGQIVGDTVIPYSDHDAVAAALRAGRVDGGDARG
jgi:UDP-N-acetylmuramoyl-L-alanyl-D-glutamate--2,6-diaminopimelate ligase